MYSPPVSHSLTTRLYSASVRLLLVVRSTPCPHGDMGTWRHGARNAQELEVSIGSDARPRVRLSDAEGEEQGSPRSHSEAGSLPSRRSVPGGGVSPRRVRAAPRVSAPGVGYLVGSLCSSPYSVSFIGSGILASSVNHSNHGIGVARAAAAGRRGRADRLLEPPSRARRGPTFGATTSASPHPHRDKIIKNTVT